MFLPLTIGSEQHMFLAARMLWVECNSAGRCDFRLRGAAKCDSVAQEGISRGIMRAVVKEQAKQGVALALLLVLGGFAIAGPTGLLAWSENLSALEVRETRIAQLEARRDALANRVYLLDPEAADPDLASELVRRNLGVMHADEVVITLED